MPEIITETLGALRVLTISNEPKRNALEGGMAEDLLRGLDVAEEDPEIRVVIVTGAGEVAFSSGHDLNALRDRIDPIGEEPFMRPTSMRKPVIAAVNGHCFAAGLILAISCDIRIASRNATFGSPGARLGMLPEGGQIARLPRLMSAARAMELMMTAEPFSAEEAATAGLANQVVPQGKALEAAKEVGETIARNSPAVVAAIKEGVLLEEREGRETVDAYEARVARSLEAQPDAKEGVQAFFEKRSPVFLKMG